MCCTILGGVLDVNKLVYGQRQVFLTAHGTPYSICSLIAAK